MSRYDKDSRTVVHTYSHCEEIKIKFCYDHPEHRCEFMGCPAHTTNKRYSPWATMIKSCPFCGGHADIHRKYIEDDESVFGTTLFYIYCENCDAKTRSFEKCDSELLNTWNDRVSDHGC